MEANNTLKSELDRLKKEHHALLEAYDHVCAENTRLKGVILETRDHATETNHLRSCALRGTYHEIRTSLNGVSAFSQLLQKPGLSEKEIQNIRHHLSQCIREAAGSLELLVDMADLMTK